MLDRELTIYELEELRDSLSETLGMVKATIVQKRKEETWAENTQRHKLKPVESIKKKQ